MLMTLIAPKKTMWLLVRRRGMSCFLDQSITIFINIATGETSQAITPHHFFNYSNLFGFITRYYLKLLSYITTKHFKTMILSLDNF